MATVKAVAIIAGDNNVKGSLQFIQDSAGVTHVKGRIAGLKPGLHGFHIHALGDTTNGCNSTGPHFNPLKKDHGAPTDAHRHAGDLGNIIAGADGVAEVSIRDNQIPLSGLHSILGRAVVVHADPDDLGRGTRLVVWTDQKSLNFYWSSDKLMDLAELVTQIDVDPYLSNIKRVIWTTPMAYQHFSLLGGHELSKSTGNAGARVACGIIGLQSSV